MTRSTAFRNLLIGLAAAALGLSFWLANTSGKLRQEAEERFFDQYNRQQLLVANHSASAIMELFGTFKRSLTLAAGLFLGQPVNMETGRDALPGLKAIHSVISDMPIIDLVIFDRDGTVVAIVPDEPKTLGANYNWRGYYRWARDEGTPGKMYVSPFLRLEGGQNRGDMTVMVAEGIYDPAGRFAGVVMITVNFDELVRRHVLSVKMGEKGYAWLIDSGNGTILVDPRGKINGQTFENAFLPRWPKLYEVARNSRRGVDGLDWYDYEAPEDSSRTVRKLLAYAPVRVENFLWTIGVCTPEEEVKELFATYLGRQQAFFSTVILTTVAGAILFLALLLLWNRMLAREVEKRTGALAEAHEKLEVTFKELLAAKKLAAIGHLALGLVHEIRNPLSSIRMNMQMIRRRLPEGGPSTENFQIMEEEILRLNGLLGDVMIFARPTPPRLARADLARIVHRALVLVGERLKNLDVTVITKWEEEPIEVVCDSEQIMQVLLNLLLNSLQALETTQSARFITIGGGVEGGFAVLAVADSGPGIPQGQMDSLFDPFFTTKAQGAGLGLSIAQRIAQSHGGTLEVAQDVSAGAVFTLRLPVDGPDKSEEPTP